ncbi:MAG: hypothetical protein M1453_07955 [Acidobacteria bacterium]|nr:hypothetical protein [Acidobacteriota bacterium]
MSAPSTSQSASEAENVKHPNVVLFPAGEREDPRKVHTIRQEDLIELQYLSRLFTEAREAWEQKRDWIKDALRAGAGVEAGLLAAELVPRRRPAHQVGDCAYDELVVR